VTPIVAVFEDLHWADEPTLLLLRHLAQTVTSIPMLMIGTYRDVELSTARPFANTLEVLIREKLALRISLRRLPLPGVEAMLTALSGQTTPAVLARIVFDKTEGNPFFVEEVYRNLTEEGTVFDEHGAWRGGLRESELQVPEGVRLVIGRRLERLGAEALRVLTTAAVIGRSFSLRLLETLERSWPDAALDAIEEAERVRLVEAERTGREPRYRFVHELVRQTLAETLSLPRRQRLHVLVADAIERTYGANVHKQASAMAHHLYQAGAAADPEKTISYLLMAARLAAAGAAHEEALENLNNALCLVEGERHPRAAELYAARAVASRSVSRFADAVSSYERAIALFIETGNIAGAAEASFHLGYIHLWNGEGPRAYNVIDRAVQLFGPEPSPLRYRLLLLKAASLALTGDDIEGGLATLTKAKVMEASMPETRADGFPLMIEARLRFAAAQFDQADRYARQAIGRFRATGDLWGEAEVFDHILAALWLGRPAEAEPLVRELLSCAERVGHQNVVWTSKSLAATMLLARGNLEEAERAERSSFEFGRSFGGGWCFISAVVLGSIAHYRGRFEEASRWFRLGLRMEHRTYWSGLLNGGLFWTLAAMRDPSADAALRSARGYLPVPGHQLSAGSCGCLGFVVEGLARLERYEEAAALQEHTEHVVNNGPYCVQSFHLFRTSAGIAAASARNWSRAEEHHRTAVHQADTAPYRIAQPIAREWYAEMLLARGQPGDRTKAETLQRDALTMYDEMLMPLHGQRISLRIANG
jgi:tetratricopeptide (TPR) repeat protein